MTAQDAERFLIDLLSRGPLPAKEIRGRAREAGHSRRMMTQAKRKLGIKLRRSGGLGANGLWLLELAIPTTTAPPIRTSETEPVEIGDALGTYPGEGEVAEIDDPIRVLLAHCRELHAELKPTMQGSLGIESPQPLPYDLLEALMKHEREIVDHLVGVLATLDTQEALFREHWGDLSDAERARETSPQVVWSYCQQKGLDEEIATGLERRCRYLLRGEVEVQGAGRNARVRTYDWVAPLQWRCPRCGLSALTLDAAPRCRTCGFREAET